MLATCPRATCLLHNRATHRTVHTLLRLCNNLTPLLPTNTCLPYIKASPLQLSRALTLLPPSAIQLQPSTAPTLLLLSVTLPQLCKLLTLPPPYIPLTLPQLYKRHIPHQLLNNPTRFRNNTLLLPTTTCLLLKPPTPAVQFNKLTQHLQLAIPLQLSTAPTPHQLFNRLTLPRLPINNNPTLPAPSAPAAVTRLAMMLVLNMLPMVVMSTRRNRSSSVV